MIINGELMSAKKSIAIAGLILALVGVSCGLLTARYYDLQDIRLNAEAKNKDRVVNLVSTGCGHTLKNISIENRVLVLDQAVNLKLVLINGSEAECDAEISLNATTFKISPESPQHIKVPTGTMIFLWNVAPQKIGPQQITFSSGVSTIEKGFMVEDPSFLSRFMVTTISVISAVLGPIATLPWWLDRRRKGLEKQAPHI